MDNETITTTKKVWSHKTIGLITIILGIYNGLLVASINWYWMGRRQKALLHLAAIPILFFIYIIFLKQYIGLTSRDTIALSTTGYSLRVVVNLILVFVTAVYLYKSTEKNIEQLGEAISTVDIRWSALVLVIAFLLLIGINLLNTLIEQAQLRSFQNHVYCELLAPGMTYKDVNSALEEIDQYTQVSLGEGVIPENAPSDVDYYRVIWWNALDIEQKHDLRIGLGYNNNDQLTWITRASIPNPIPIICPWNP